MVIMNHLDVKRLIYLIVFTQKSLSKDYVLSFGSLRIRNASFLERAHLLFCFLISRNRASLIEEAKEEHMIVLGASSTTHLVNRVI